MCQIKKISTFNFTAVLQKHFSSDFSFDMAKKFYLSFSAISRGELAEKIRTSVYSQKIVTCVPKFSKIKVYVGIISVYSLPKGVR